jgi:hypothetical protein
MATIYKRKVIDGRSSWRVMFRRKGYPTFCLSFDTEAEARDWAREHEPKFLMKPSSYYEHIDKISVLNNRQREVKRLLAHGTKR